MRRKIRCLPVLLIASALLAPGAVSAAPSAAGRGLPPLSQSNQARIDALLARMSLARGRIDILSDAVASSSPAVLGAITSEERVR